MRRRDYLYTTGSAAIGLGLAGCLGGDDESPDEEGPDNTDETEPESETDETGGDESGNETGLLSTAVSDDPADIGDFESLVVTIEQIRVFPKGEDDSADGDEEDDHDHSHEDDGGDSETTETSDGEQQDSEEEGAPSHEGEEEATGEDGSENGGGRITIPVDDAKADLVDLQGDAKSIIDETELDVGTYSHLQLVVSDEVDATLADGGEASVMTPGNAPLQFNAEFDIRADTATQFVADFAPHRRGPPESTEYMLRPVPTEITVSYEPLGGQSAEDDSTEETESESSDEEQTDGSSEQTDDSGSQDEQTTEE